MTTVGVRELKARLSHYLRRARTGERIIVTDRLRAVAVWDGDRPQGTPRPAKIKGRPVADAVLEVRR